MRNFLRRPVQRPRSACRSLSSPAHAAVIASKAKQSRSKRPLPRTHDARRNAIRGPGADTFALGPGSRLGASGNVDLVHRRILVNRGLSPQRIAASKTGDKGGTHRTQARCVCAADIRAHIPSRCLVGVAFSDDRARLLTVHRVFPFL
jgi:hypothetical protein